MDLPTTMGRWVASFPDFASRIEWKLVQEEYGGLLFDNSASLVLSIARQQKLVVLVLALQKINLVHQGMKTQASSKSIYTGYVKKNGLKVLTVALPNGLIGALYGPVSA